MPSARGTLSWTPAASHLDLLADPVAAALADEQGVPILCFEPDHERRHRQDVIDELTQQSGLPVQNRSGET